MAISAFYDAAPPYPWKCRVAIAPPPPPPMGAPLSHGGLPPCPIAIATPQQSGSSIFHRSVSTAVTSAQIYRYHYTGAHSGA